LGDSAIEVHDQTGVYGLTARTRLPDAILMPGLDSDDEDDDV
jgi:hypothetical protein